MFHSDSIWTSRSFPAKSKAMDASVSNLENSGILYVVSTPIGNLSDVTFRAVQVLKEAEAFVAESFERVRTLLVKFAPERLSGKITYVKVNQATEARNVGKVISLLRSGKKVALMSDAGTPTISDPGWMIVDAAHKIGVRVVPIPGASALTAALSVSGFPPVPFIFLGFLPRKGRTSFLKKYVPEGFKGHIVIFLSSHRLREELEFLSAFFGGESELFLIKEMTKIHEKYWRLRLQEADSLISSFGDSCDDFETKGEWVAVLRLKK